MQHRGDIVTHSFTRPPGYNTARNAYPILTVTLPRQLCATSPKCCTLA